MILTGFKIKELYFRVQWHLIWLFLGLIILILIAQLLIWILTVQDIALKPEHIIAIYGGVLVGISIYSTLRVFSVNHAREMDFFLASILNHWMLDLSESVNRARMFWEHNPSFCEDLEGGKSAMDYFNNRDDKNQKDRRAVVAVLNYLEHLAILVKNGTVDEEMLKERMCSTYKMFYDKSEFFIEALRLKERDKLKKNYCEFVDLAEKWHN